MSLAALDPAGPPPQPPMGIVAPHKEATSLTAFKDITFGSVAGIVGKTVEFPFDTVKVRLQSQGDHQPLLYRGPLECFKRSLVDEGIRGLYRGLSLPLFGAAAENSALFFSYNLAQTAVARTVYPEIKKGEALPLGALVFCGAVSGAFASFILTPIELVKCRIQVQPTAMHRASAAAAAAAPVVPAFKTAGMHTIAQATTIANPRGALNILREVYGARGFWGLWDAQLGTFIRETGGSAAWFGAYEYLSATFRRLRGRDRNTAGEMMIAGAAAGVSYNFICFPADTVKSRMQTTPPINGKKPMGFWEVGAGMYRAGGIKTMYRGCGITCMRSAPSSAVIFLVYETLKKYFV